METRLLIAGEQVAGEGPGLDVENPYTQTTLATVALPSSEQVDAAIGAARAAARGWGDRPAVERCELLHEVAARLRASADTLAALMTREGGKPLVENADEVGWTAAAFDYYAEMGQEGLEAFQETKHVHIETKIAAKSWWYPYGATA
jgi:acyl-CoA reductase-like NAD-dependent aldehyde dehydrogenase